MATRGGDIGVNENHQPSRSKNSRGWRRFCAHATWLSFIGDNGNIKGSSGHERYAFMNLDDFAGIVTTEEIGFNT